MQNPRNLPEQGMSDWDELQEECTGKCSECGYPCEVREAEPVGGYAEFLFALAKSLASERELPVFPDPYKMMKEGN